MASKKDNMYKYRDIDPKLMNNLQFSELQSDSYSSGFDRLAAWVDISLETNRPELSQILYPMFVHCYLEIVKQSQPTRAGNMLKRHRPRFVEAMGACVSVSQELNDLGSVTYPQHLKTNKLAISVLSSKTHVKMSRASKELLFNFVQRNNLWALLGIINQFIDIEVQEQALRDVRPLTGLQVQDVGDEGLRINALPLKCGLLEGCLEDQLLARFRAPAPHQDDAAPAAAPAAPSAPAPTAAAPAVAAAEAPEGAVRPDDSAAAAEPQAAAAAATADGAAAGAAAEAAAAGTPAEGEAATAAAAPQTDAKTKKDSAAKKAELAKRKAAKDAPPPPERVMPTEPRIARTLPLPTWAPAVRDAALEQLKRCAPLGGAQPPSCCMFTFPQAAQTLQCVSLTEDVTRLAAGFSDSSIRMYDLADGPQADEGGTVGAELDPQRGFKRMYGHSGPVYDVSYNYDGSLLYSAGMDGTVRLWASDMAANLVIWRGHLNPVWAVRACPHGHWLASGGSDRTARLWCNERLECMRNYVGHQADVDALAWHPNSHLLVTGSSGDRMARVWDVKSGGCVRLLAGHEGGVSALCVNPGGDLLAVGQTDGSVALWELRAAKRLAVLPRPGGGWAGTGLGGVQSLAFSRSGQLLAVGSADHNLALWQPQRVHEDLAYAKALFQEFPAVASCGPVPYKLLDVHLTRGTALVHVAFTRSNLLLASGARLPPPRKRRRASENGASDADADWGTQPTNG